MKAFRTVGPVVVAVALAGSALAAGSEGSSSKPGAGRIGIGMNLSSAEATYSLDSSAAIGVGVDLDSVTGDSKSTALGFRAWYQSKLKSADPVDFFFLAGMGYRSDDPGGGAKSSGIDIFGGIGVEYFLPGTQSLSIEAKVGLMVEFLSDERTYGVTVKTNSTRVAIEDLSGGLFVIRYYIN